MEKQIASTSSSALSRQGNKAVNKIHCLLAQKQFGLNSDKKDEFELQCKEMELISLVVEVFDRRVDRHRKDSVLGEIQMNRFRNALEDYLEADAERLKKLFGELDFKRLFVGSDPVVIAQEQGVF